MDKNHARAFDHPPTRVHRLPTMDERLVSRARGASTTKIRARVESCRRPPRRATREPRSRDVTRSKKKKINSSLSRAHHVHEIHPHRQRSIASVMFESVRVQLERHEGDVARIHGLELEPLLRIRLEVGVGDEILDGVEDFLEHRPLGESRFEHGRSRPRVARWRDRRDFKIDRARWSACENAEASARRRETRDERRETRDETSDATHTQKKLIIAWDVRARVERDAGHR